MAVFKRNSIWYARVSYAGERIVKSAGKGATKKQAQELAAKIESDLIHAAHAKTLGRTPDYTLEQALVRWMKEYASQLSNYDKIASHVRQIEPFAPGTKLVDALEVCNEIKKSMLAGGLNNRTINIRLSIIRRVLNLAYRKWDWIAEPLATKLELLSEKGNVRHIYATKREVEKLASACNNPNASKLIIVAAYTGVRQGKLFQLTKDNIQGDYIVLDENTKTGKPRLIPIHPKIKEIVALLPLPITKRQLRVDWEKARLRTGLEHLRWHDLRHTFASWLASSGAQATDVRDLLGHTTLATTNRYTHLFKRRLKDVVDKLD